MGVLDIVLDAAGVPPAAPAPVPPQTPATDGPAVISSTAPTPSEPKETERSRKRVGPAAFDRPGGVGLATAVQVTFRVLAERPIGPDIPLVSRLEDLTAPGCLSHLSPDDQHVLQEWWGPCTLVRLGRRRTKKAAGIDQPTKQVSLAICPVCDGWVTTIAPMTGACEVTFGCEGRPLRVDPPDDLPDSPLVHTTIKEMTT